MSKTAELNWIFTGGELNELLIVTNLNEVPAKLSFDVYFEDREPIKGLTLAIPAERVLSFKLDEPFCDQQYKILSGKYTLVLHSNLPVVAVLGDKN